MKYYHIVIVLLMGLNAGAQDSTSIAKNSKWKIGARNFFDNSPNFQQNSSFFLTYSFGFQCIYKLPPASANVPVEKSKSSIQFGFGELTRAEEAEYIFLTPGYITNQYFELYHLNLHMPLAYRLDIKSFYFTAGIYIDYDMAIISNDPVAFDSLKMNSTHLPDKKFNAGLTMSVGYERTISKTLSVFAEAEFTYNVLPAFQPVPDYSMARGFQFSPDGPIIYLGYGDAQINYINYGIALGINYKIPETQPKPNIRLL